MNKVPRKAVDYFFMFEEISKANVNSISIMIDENSRDRYAMADRSKRRRQ